MGNLNLTQMTAGQSQKHVSSNDGDNEIDIAITESVVLDFTAGNITLTDEQFREQFLFECNNVAAARDLILPANIKRFFAVTNQADESFDVTVTKGSGVFIVAPGVTKIFYTDGTTNDLRDITGASGGSSWIDLTDTDPSSYSGQAGKLVRVNAAPDGLEFVSPAAAGAGSSILGLFQGLWGGTRNAENDADADRKIHVDSLKLATFDDGVGVSDLADLELDVGAASGNPGALDTGTITANTWYELWLIQRSDTEANALLGSKASDWDTDQSGVSDDADFRLRNSSAETNGAQSFQPSVTSDLLYVDFKIAEAGAIPVNSMIWVTVESDSAGDPDGTPLATSIKIRADLIGAADVEVKFAFPVPATLTGSTTYWLVVHGDYAISGVNHIKFRGNTTTSYAGGLAKDFDGASTWTTPMDGSIVDFWFKTHMDIGGNNPSLPTNYDRKVKIGYFYSDTGANVEPHRFMDKKIQFHGDIVTTANPGSGVQALLDLKVAIPPSPVIIQALLTQAIGGEVRVSGIPYGAVAIGQASPPSPPQHSVRETDTVASTQSLQLGPLMTEGQAVYIAADAAATISFKIEQIEWVR